MFCLLLFLVFSVNILYMGLGHSGTSCQTSYYSLGWNADINYFSPLCMFLLVASICFSDTLIVLLHRIGPSLPPPVQTANDTIPFSAAEVVIIQGCFPLCCSWAWWTHQHPRRRPLGELHRTILQMLKMGIKNCFSGDIKDKNKITGDRRLHKGRHRTQDTASS